MAFSTSEPCNADVAETSHLASILPTVAMLTWELLCFPFSGVAVIGGSGVDLGLSPSMPSIRTLISISTNSFFFGGAAVVHAKKAEKSGKLTRKNQVPISERLATLQLGWLKENESQESQEISNPKIYTGLYNEVSSPTSYIDGNRSRMVLGTPTHRLTVRVLTLLRSTMERSQLEILP